MTEVASPITRWSRLISERMGPDLVAEFGSSHLQVEAYCLSPVTRIGWAETMRSRSEGSLTTN